MWSVAVPRAIRSLETVQIFPHLGAAVRLASLSPRLSCAGFVVFEGAAQLGGVSHQPSTPPSSMCIVFAGRGAQAACVCPCDEEDAVSACLPAGANQRNQLNKGLKRCERVAGFGHWVRSLLRDEG